MEPFIYNRRSRKFLGLRVAAIFETLIFLIVFLLLNFLFSDGKRMVDYYLHPFWIIILLTTVQYGTAEGLFAAVLSTIFLYAGNLPHQKPEELFFDYQLRLALLPALWLLTAFILGELRMRLEWEKQQLKEDLLHLKAQVEKITDEYEILKESHHNLEIHLGSQEETAATSFKVFKALEALDPAQIIFGVNSLIETALHPKKFSVYAKGSQGLEAVTSVGWESTDRYCRRFIPSSPLFKGVIEDKKLVSAINKDDLPIIKNEGILAYALTDPESGESFGMVKVEDLDFRSLNLSRLETFKIVCDLIGRAYANAKKYKKNQEENIYAPSLPAYSHASYQALSKHLQALGKELKFQTGVVSIQLLKGHVWKKEDLAALANSLPAYAPYFTGTKPNKELQVIYPIGNNEDPKKVEHLLGDWLNKKCGLKTEDYLLEHFPLGKEAERHT
jgi:hypothetical protein